MSAKVAVLGGGVAGLTVAHELVDRGFDVTVYEKTDILGGKARSYPARGRERNGDPISGHSLPGEHGFRFFPGFYRHLDDTMSRIPVAERYARDGRKSVLDCLLPIDQEMLVVAAHDPILVPAAVPMKVHAIRNALRLSGALTDCGLTEQDLETFATKIWQLATSCPERRETEYERIEWRDFVESKNRSEEYYWYLASGLTRALVAARARYASTKTMGNLALRLLAVAADVGQSTDRVLCGPTNGVWIDPWVEHITSRRRGPYGDRGDCAIESGTVTAIHVEGNKVVEVSVQRGERTTRERADIFVSALPVKALADLIRTNDELKKERFFQRIVQIDEDEGDKECMRKMSGLQIYCRRALTLRPQKDEFDPVAKYGQRLVEGLATAPLNRGHQLFLDSPWGLTSIAQGMFWDEMPEGVKDILSIDISSWDMKGIKFSKMASECSPLEVFQEVVYEIRHALGGQFLPDEDIIGWNLDAAQVGEKPGDQSPELLLVNRSGSWALRPTAETPVANLVIAADFVRTGTDLACMEGANEAGRLAVNEVLKYARSDARPCAIWDQHEPAVLLPLQEVDRQRYRRGLPWSDTGRIAAWLTRGASLGPVVADPIDGPRVSIPPSGASAYRPPRSEWDDSPVPPMKVRALTSLEIEEELKDYSRYARPGRSDSMFRRWRLYERTETPYVLVPLHVYDADTLILYGTAHNFAKLEQLTEGTGYHPVSAQLDGNRIGFAELWVVRYHDTSAGPCNEIAINFVANTDPAKRQYRYQSPYSTLIPMMDSANRLFTPEIIIQEDVDPGCIEYGNKLFGMNKLHAEVIIEAGADSYDFVGHQLERWSEEEGGPVAIKPGEFAVSGKIDVRTTNVDTVALASALAIEMGPIATLRNTWQVETEQEITGGLATRNFRSLDVDINKARGIEIRAAYKFAPRVKIPPSGPWGFDLKFGSAPFGRLLEEMGFFPRIAARVPHLKSVLYTDDCPTPDD